MANIGVHFASDCADWETPQPFFDWCNRRWGPLEVDVCASKDNTKCTIYFDKAVDGLSVSWGYKICWMNPPYGDAIPDWVEKAHRESVLGAMVVALLPARTSPPWWHNHVMYADEIVLIGGRIKFVGAANCAPFPSCVAIWRPGPHLEAHPLVTSAILSPYVRGGKKRGKEE